MSCWLILIGSPLGAADRPNILLVMTDDQGYGDLGLHGNPVLRTPRLDRFAQESVTLKHFYVSPVCSPTRSSLLTGQYNYRTGVVDTFIGRSMMRPEVPTLPQMLQQAGYRTGLFGKWHLGDNYPLRPEDRGFTTTLWHRGGGLSQPSDPPEADPKTAYFDPYLVRNGRSVQAKGYCTDIFTDAAIEFMTAREAQPFFAYVAYNAPHSPYQVPDAEAQPYRDQPLRPELFPKIGQPWASPKFDAAELANIYGMITNIDTNFGRMLDALAQSGQARDTIVIFLTDNGPGSPRFNSGLRFRKGTVYEGGIRVPCFVRWPAQLPARRVVTEPAAHIDITPTLLEAAGLPAAAPPAMDGRSLLPLLRDGLADWPQRTLFFQWHRGDAPEKFRAFAARGPRYKLTQSIGANPNVRWQPRYELFDLQNDPYEETDLSRELPEVVADLKQQYEAWFKDVTQAGFAPVRIHVGNPKENPTRLTRQDWRGDKAGWDANSIGHWELTVERAGRYRVTLQTRTTFTAATLSVGRTEVQLPNERAEPVKRRTVEVTLMPGPLVLQCVLQNGLRTWGAEYVDVEWIAER